MSYGLQIINDHGTIQFDEVFQNYVVHSKGSGQANLTEIPKPMVNGNIVPFMFFVSSNNYSSNDVFTSSFNMSSGSNVVKPGGMNPAGAQSNFYYKWVICTLSSHAPDTFASNYGLEIYNQNGIRNYSSRQEPLKVAGHITSSFGTINVTYTTTVPLVYGHRRYVDFSAVYVLETHINQLPANSWDDISSFAFQNNSSIIKIGRKQDVYSGSGDTNLVFNYEGDRTILFADFYQS